jgi:hypothetical protein
VAKSAVQDIITHANLTQTAAIGGQMAPLLWHADSCPIAPGTPCNCGLTAAAGHASAENLVADTKKWARHASDCAGGKSKKPCTCGYTQIWGKD